MLLLAVFVYDPLTRIVSLFLAADLAPTAVGLFITLARQSGFWNSLPDEPRNLSFDGFERFLKTFSIITSAFLTRCAIINILFTYLLI